MRSTVRVIERVKVERGTLEQEWVEESVTAGEAPVVRLESCWRLSKSRLAGAGHHWSGDKYGPRDWESESYIRNIGKWMRRGVCAHWRSNGCSAGELLEALSQGWLELDVTGGITRKIGGTQLKLCTTFYYNWFNIRHSGCSLVNHIDF